MHFANEKEFQDFMRGKHAKEHGDKVRGCADVPMNAPEPKRPAKGNKYGNRKVEIDGIVFDSEKEGRHYVELKTMERAGIISRLVLQPTFELAPATTIHGKKSAARTYRGDFQYEKDGITIVEDVKGMKTAVYILKRHLMKTVHNIEIVEI